MSRFLRRSDEAPRPPARQSVYADRFTDDAEQHRERWEPVAETDPVTGALRWLPGWERRAQGWRPLDEFLRGP